MGGGDAVGASAACAAGGGDAGFVDSPSNRLNAITSEGGRLDAAGGAGSSGQAAGSPPGQQALWPAGGVRDRPPAEVRPLRRGRERGRNEFTHGRQQDSTRRSWAHVRNSRIGGRALRSGAESEKLLLPPPLPPAPLLLASSSRGGGAAGGGGGAGGGCRGGGGWRRRRRRQRRRCCCCCCWCCWCCCCCCCTVAVVAGCAGTSSSSLLLAPPLCFW